MRVEVRRRDRRALVGLGIAFLLYLALDQILLPGYDRLQAAATLVEEKESQLNGYRQAVARQGRYETTMAEVTARIEALETQLIDVESASLAGVELQTRIEQVAEAAGLTLSQRTPGQIQPAGDDYAELPIAVSFESRPDQLVAFLDGLRALDKHVTVRQLQVTPVQQIPNPGESFLPDRTLRVSMLMAALASAFSSDTEDDEA